MLRLGASGRAVKLSDSFCPVGYVFLYSLITCPNQTEGNYRANMNSAACPFGYSQEETIKKLWNGQ